MTDKAKSDLAREIAVRRRKLQDIAEDVEQLMRLTTVTHLQILEELRRTPERSKAFLQSLSDSMQQVEDVAHSLHERRSILDPKNPPETAKDWDARAYAAHDALYKFEALLDVINQRVNPLPDGHLIMVAELCKEQLPKLRLALYGEAMGP